MVIILRKKSPKIYKSNERYVVYLKRSSIMIGRWQNALNEINFYRRTFLDELFEYQTHVLKFFVQKSPRNHFLKKICSKIVILKKTPNINRKF